MEASPPERRPPKWWERDSTIEAILGQAQCWAHGSFAWVHKERNWWSAWSLICPSTESAKDILAAQRGSKTSCDEKFHVACTVVKSVLFLESRLQGWQVTFSYLLVKGRYYLPLCLEELRTSRQAQMIVIMKCLSCEGYFWNGISW